MLVRVVAGAVALVAALVAVALLRLMDGPVNLDFLGLPTAQVFDTPGGKLRVSADHIHAEWGGLQYPIRVVFETLRVLDDDVEIAMAPSIALSFEPRSVVKGRLLPKSIVVERPTLNAVIDREGGMMRRIMASTDSSSQGGFVELLIEQLLSEPNSTSLLGQLDKVEVERATITLRDVKSGVTWVAPAGRASLKRDAAGVIIAADARFSNAGEPIDVALSATYARDRSRISAEAKIEGLKPYMIADLSPDAAIVRGVDMALAARLNIEADGQGGVRTVAIDVTGGEGTVNLPGILSAPQRVRSVSAHASVDAGSHTARIDHIDVDLGAAKLSIAGNGMKTDQGQVFTGRAELRAVPIDRLGDFWPIVLAPGGREWAIANVSGGSVDIAAEFGLAAPGNDMSQISVTRAVALLDYRDMKVRYMPHMPELEGVAGTARFEGGTLHFDVAVGTAVGLRLTGGTIDLANLDGPGAPTATMRLPIAGPAPVVMALLARPKLGLPRDALYDPKRVAGEAAIDLQLAFPLLNSLNVADIEIKADAALTAFSLKNAIGNVDFTEATGKVSYIASQLSVAGRGKLDGHPVDVTWREMFGARVPFRQRYELKGTLPTPVMVKAGFVSPEPYLSGPVGVVMSYQVQPNGTGELIARLDLRGAKALLVPLSWSKPAGTEGQVSLNLKLAPGAKISSVDFDGRSSGLTAKGQLKFDGDNAVQQVTLQQLAIGRTDVALDWKRVAGGVDIALRGPSIELSRVREAMRVREEQATKAPATQASIGRTSLSLQLGDFLVQRGSLGSINGRVVMNGDRVSLAELGLGGGKGTSVQIAPTGTGRRLAIYVPDVGLLLRTAGWLDGFASGANLDIQGRFDDSSKVTTLDGQVKLGPYRLEQVAPRPDIGNLNSTIAGLNRAGNALQQFNGLDAKFLKVGDRIDIKEGRTSGQSIGLTTAGTMDVAAETVRLRGVIVPGFAINNLLSNVPLLGPLLTGGKDGGVFAFSYRLDGHFDDMKPDVSMLSAITPGALRELFTSAPDTMRAEPPPPAPERN